EKVTDRVAKLLAAQTPIVQNVYARSFVGSGRVTAMLDENRTEKSNDFERRLTPELLKIPDARVGFRSQFGWGSSGRDITFNLGGEDPELLYATAVKLVNQMAGMKSLAAPRIAGDLNRPEIVIRPRLDLAANLGVTTAAL